MKCKTDSLKFDAMFGLTFSLYENADWMHDNECYGEGGQLDQAITLLGNTWKKLLEKSNEELGIDAEYTRKGIEAFLEDFEELVDSCECIETSFKFK